MLLTTTAALSLFLWVERPHNIENPRNLPEIVDTKNKVYRYVSLDEYSAMVRDKEMPLNFPKEARIAQEILARSYFLQNRKMLVESTEMYQVFNFSNNVNVFAPKQIVTNSKNLEYHSRCPGYTIGPNKERIACPLHAQNPYRWSYQIRPDEWDLELAVRKMLHTDSLDKKRKIRLPFRAKIKSVFIDHFNPVLKIVHGRGFGHGRGMCQFGAKTLAERGYKSHEVLEYFYPKSQLTKL